MNLTLALKHQLQYNTSMRWTDKEIKLLKKAYPTTVNEDLAIKMDRPVSSILNKASRLGLKKKTIGANPVIGQQYRYWTVISSDTRHNGKRIYWYCQCQCGHCQWIYYSYLFSEMANACRRCAQKSNEEFVNIFNIAKRTAKVRKISFEISVDFIRQLWKEQNGKCALTNLDLLPAHRHADKDKRTASLDRIDSSKGYIVGNVQWVHKDINKIKLNIDEDYFIRLCSLVAKHRG